jgi:hypothetical protein
MTWYTAPAASYRNGLAMWELYLFLEKPSMSVIWD